MEAKPWSRTLRAWNHSRNRSATYVRQTSRKGHGKVHGVDRVAYVGDDALEPLHELQKSVAWVEVTFFWNSWCEKGDPGRPGLKALASNRLAADTPPEEMER